MFENRKMIEAIKFWIYSLIKNQKDSTRICFEGLLTFFGLAMPPDIYSVTF